jgi:Primase C terminal 1 (PriCT-1)
VAGSLRRIGLNPDEIRSALEKINQLRCDPPLSKAEIENISRSSEKWEPGTTESYFSTPDGIYWNKSSRDSVAPVRLTNFDCRIITDIVEDDGVDKRRSCELEVKLFGQSKRFIVSAADFANISWILKNVGSRAVASAGRQIERRSL